MNFEDIRVSELINPTDKQRECIKATDTHKFTLYGGAAGGGKSYILRWWLIRQLLKRFAETGIEGLTAGLFSSDYPTLRDRQASRIKMEFPAWLGELRESRDEGWNFFIKPEFGSGRIALRNLTSPEAYKSAEFCDIAIEELSENNRNILEDLILFRLRSPGIARPCFLGATNPTGPGLQWIKKLWIDGARDRNPKAFPPELAHLFHEFAYVPALLGENPHIPANYAESLKGLPEKKRKALLEGDWTVPEGQYFTNFEDAERRVRHGIVTQIIKPWWPRWISQDWGFKHHSPVHWHTTGDVTPEEAKLLGRDWVTTKKCVFTYREKITALAEENSSERELGMFLAAVSAGEKIDRWFLSEDAFAKKTTQKTPAELLSEGAGRAFRSPERVDMAPGSRVAGWRFMYQLIQDDAWFISDMCPEALNAIPALEYDSEKGGEDIRKTDSLYDDVGDELRYGLADMLNNKAKPWAVATQEKVQQAFREKGPTVANMVFLSEQAKRKGKTRWTGR